MGGLPLALLAAEFLVLMLHSLLLVDAVVAEPDEGPGGITINNRKKPGTLNDNFTRQR